MTISGSDIKFDSNYEKSNVMEDYDRLTHTIPFGERIFIAIEFWRQIFGADCSIDLTLKSRMSLPREILKISILNVIKS